MGKYKGKRNPDSPDSNAAGKRKGFIPFDEMRFCNIELSSEEKDEFRAAVADGSLEPLDVDEYVGAGYELTYKRDSKGAGRLVSLRAPLYELDNAGLILTGRGGDTATAFAVLSFKIQYIVGDRSWAQAEFERRGNSQDIG